MRYLGGKTRIVKELSKFLESKLTKDKTFVDLFCGSCNVVSNVAIDCSRIANDNNKYLITMWQMLQKGWLPPKIVSNEYYNYVKSLEDNSDEIVALKSFIGFGCSFSGKWWGGYARDSSARNYAEEAYNGIIKKLQNLKNVTFLCSDYSDIEIKSNYVIYCDIPYKDTTEYNTKFDHERFYKWALTQAVPVYVSEYTHNVPSFGKIEWELASKQDMRQKDGSKKNTKEVVFSITT